MKRQSSNGINISIGLLLSLSAVFIAFEWSTTGYSAPRIIENQIYDSFDEDVIPVPILKANQASAPIPLPRMPDLTRLVIVDNLDPIPEDHLEITEEIVDVDLPWLDFDETPEISDDAPFLIVEHMPSFPGGESALFEFLNNSIQYPWRAMEDGVQGKVYVQFVVERDGSISQIEIVRGENNSLNKESLRVINIMPNWNPGKQNGKPVRVRMNLPVNFVLN